MNKQLVVNADYNGITVTFTNDGWFNATHAAAMFEKDPTAWLRQRDAVEYIAASAKRNGNYGFLTELNEIKGLKGETSASRSRLLNLVKKTGFVRTKAGAPETGGGTWLHPKLAVRFAQWLDIDFAIWCDEQIDKIIRTNAAPPDVQDLMRLILSNTVSEWELRFPDSYYFAIAKVTGTQYRGHSNGTPAVFGQITQQWIYAEIMPLDVLAEVKARKQQSEKIHQWFTNGGIALLSKQITKVQAIAESSVDYADFKSRCYQSGKSKGQLRLVYPQGGVA